MSLIQIRDYYFVEDGHHRISVARAFREEAVDAEVVRWEINDMGMEPVNLIPIDIRTSIMSDNSL